MNSSYEPSPRFPWRARVTPWVAHSFALLNRGRANAGQKLVLAVRRKFLGSK